MDADRDLALEMLRRSYFAVDGLWFVMLEEARGAEGAMELDERVWRVMAKVQARKARELLHCEGNSPSDLVECLALKLTSEGHEFELERISDDCAEVAIRRCPWREVLEGAGRTHLGPESADRICATAAATWAREFSAEGMPPIVSELAAAICHGGECCRFSFRRAREEEALG